MVAQNIGAGAWPRVSQITNAGLVIGAALTGAFCLVSVVFAGPLLSIFLPPASGALSIARHANAVVIWNFVLFGEAMVLLGVVRANGAVWGPLAILVFAMFPVQLGVAVTFDRSIGVDALWASYLIGSAAALGLSVLYYRLANWRQGDVLSSQECKKHVNATTRPMGSLKPVET